MAADTFTSVAKAGDTAKAADRRSALGGYVTPIFTGLLIVAAGLLPWTPLAQVSLRVRPDLPWAALATLAYLGILLPWLNGSGPAAAERGSAAPASPALAAKRTGC
jgi:hypothetical protein